MLKTTLVVAWVCCVPLSAAAQSGIASWLDRPLVPWNGRAPSVPSVVPAGETTGQVAERCDLVRRSSTAAERALADAGWLPYLHVDRKIADRDVEIVGAMTAADEKCLPAEFNIFVFAGEKLAGTLSPVNMTSQRDGAVGAVRLAADDTIVAEFARYAVGGPTCCPSSRVAVRYRIDRAGPQAVVVPVSLQPRR